MSKGKNTDFESLLGSFKLPGLDMGGFVDYHRKNFEAIAEANRIAAEGMQAMMARQVELMQQSVEQLTAMAKGASAQSADPAAGAQAAQAAFEQSIANLKELADLASKSGAGAFEVLQARFQAALQEVQALGKPGAK